MSKTRTIRGEEYRIIVLKIVGRWPDGRPKECIMLQDDQSTDVQDGTEFITAYAPAKVLHRRS
jgi:hypothetical protein